MNIQNAISLLKIGPEKADVSVYCFCNSPVFLT